MNDEDGNGDVGGTNNTYVKVVLSRRCTDRSHVGEDGLNPL